MDNLKEIKERVEKKISELKKKGMNISFEEKMFKGINLMDKQLSQDKSLFGYLIENGLVNDEGEKLIEELIIKHTKEFEK